MQRPARSARYARSTAVVGYLPNIYSASDALAAEARRQAVNTIVQGTAADLMKLALIRLNDALPDGVRMLLPVHDSVLLEVPDGAGGGDPPDRREAMETTPAGFTVPLKVEVKDGQDVGGVQMTPPASGWARLQLPIAQFPRLLSAFTCLK